MFNRLTTATMKTNTVLLVLIFLLLCGTLYLSFTNLKQVQLLRQENTCLWMKLDSVQQVCNKKAAKPASTAPKSTSTGSAFLDFLICEGKKSAEEEAKERAKLKSATGITDEDVIEACKKAALKTSFNYDKNSRSTQTGSITYIFTSK